MKDRVSLKADPEKVGNDNTAFLGLANEIIGIPDGDVAAQGILDIGSGTRGEAACPYARYHMPKRGHPKPFRTRADLRLFNRTMLGLLIPGRYYFVTLTSANLYPDCWDIQWRKEKSRYRLLQDWDPLRKWLQRHRLGLAWVYCFTEEGYGVIHMVIRLGMKQKRIDVKELRAYWQQLHGARQIKVHYMKESDKTKFANYISDQRRLRRMGREMMWQSQYRWRWSKGWIPQGFTKQFPKFWKDFTYDNCVPDWYRDSWLRAWIQKCHNDESNVEKRPKFKELK